MRDSCGASGLGETTQAHAPRRLSARPAESEHPETEINYSQEQQRLRKQLQAKRIDRTFVIM